jgi:hypothetical protein
MSGDGPNPDPRPFANRVRFRIKNRPLRRDLGPHAPCHPSRLILDLPHQLRQPRDVRSDPPRFVVREHLSLSGFVLVLARIDEHERLPIRVADDVAAGHLVGMPGCGEAAWGFGHYRSKDGTNREQCQYRNATEGYRKSQSSYGRLVGFCVAGAWQIASDL